MRLAVKTIFILIVIFLLSGCSDNAIITESKEDLKNVNCMRLVIFPPDNFSSEIMHKLYNFDENCSYQLSVSQKSRITCNSNQNADKKILSSFPSGYIRLDLAKGPKNIFTYYRDLTDRADNEDVQRAFATLQKHLH